jgi:hypothetical protein
LDANLAAIVIAVIGAAVGVYSQIRQNQSDKRQAEREKQRAPIDNISSSIQTAKAAADAVDTYSREVKSLNDKIDSLRVEQEKQRLKYEDDLKAVQAQAEADHKRYLAELSLFQRERDEDSQRWLEWRIGVRKLLDQLSRLNVVPDWTPNELKKKTGPIG